MYINEHGNLFNYRKRFRRWMQCIKSNLPRDVPAHRENKLAHRYGYVDYSL